MSNIVVVREVAELRAQIAAWRGEGARIGLVPTMGALHRGHLSLVAEARRRAGRVVASVFVNPTQFGPGEDYAAYPRGEERDQAALEGAACDLLYAPSVEVMYPAGFDTTVSVGKVAEPLEGRFRPGHFAGVATVVAKLFTQVAPDVAVFGQKDYQQLQVIRRMTTDLDLPVEIIGAPTMRDEVGLALSSRNAYLSDDDLRTARKLNVILRQAAASAKAGWAVSSAEDAAREELEALGFAVDYVAIVGAADLQPFAEDRVSGPARALVAATIGRTRLIDNLPV
jgi:pantoate--beta-alanine ligase